MMVNRSLVVVVALVGSGATLSSCKEAPAAEPTPAPSLAPAIPHVTAPAVAAAVDVRAPSNPETERLDARRQLYESVDALVQASEFEKARQLLDEDTARYGDDLAPEWHDLEQSYRLIADCMEHPSARLRVRAEAFVLVSQAALLKPRVLAACAKKR